VGWPVVGWDGRWWGGMAGGGVGWPVVGLGVIIRGRTRVIVPSRSRPSYEK